MLRLGLDLEKEQLPQVIVSAGSWFDFEDFEIANQDELLSQYPNYKFIIERLSAVNK